VYPVEVVMNCEFEKLEDYHGRVRVRCKNCMREFIVKSIDEVAWCPSSGKCEFGEITESEGTWFGTCSKCGITTAMASPDESVQCGRIKRPSVARSTEDIGPGTAMANILKRLNIAACPRCNQRRRAMDNKGNDWCEENIDTVVGWLREEAEKRKLPFVEFAAKLLIRRAISVSRKSIDKRKRAM